MAFHVHTDAGLAVISAFLTIQNEKMKRIQTQTHAKNSNQPVNANE